MLIVIVNGARKLPDEEEILESWITETVKGLRSNDSEPVILIEGGAAGVDSLANMIGDRPPFTDSLTVHALWDRYGNRAGPRRNGLMGMIATALSASHDGYRAVLLSIPGPASRGSWQGAEDAVKRGLPVYMLTDYADPDRLAKFAEFQAKQI